MSSQEISGILISIMSIAILVLIAIIQRKTEKMKIIQTQLNTVKVKAYSKVFDLFFDILKNQKIQKKVQPNTNYIKLMDAKKTIFLYGSDDVINAFSKYLQYSSSQNEERNNQILEQIFNLFLLMRKDIGYDKTTISYPDFLMYIMQDINEVEKFMELTSN